jgi:hypothetical protein
MRALSTVTLGIVVLAASGSLTPALFAQTEDTGDCTAKLSTFVREIDDLLARRPGNLNDVLAILNRYFPENVQGCGPAVAFQTISKSSYFKGMERHGSITLFSLSNAKISNRGAAIQVSVTDAGHWNPPFAIWSPPYL